MPSWGVNMVSISAASPPNPVRMTMLQTPMEVAAGGSCPIAALKGLILRKSVKNLLICFHRSIQRGLETSIPIKRFPLLIRAPTRLNKRSWNDVIRLKKSNPDVIDFPAAATSLGDI